MEANGCHRLAGTLFIALVVKTRWIPRKRLLLTPMETALSAVLHGRAGKREVQ